MISIGFSYSCTSLYRLERFCQYILTKPFESFTITKKNHQTSIINTIVLLFFPGSLARYPTLISLRRPSTARLEASWTPWRNALYGDDRFGFTYSVTSLLRTSKAPSCELGRGQSENRIPGLPDHGFSHIIFYCTSEAKPYRDLHSVIVNQY